MTQRVFRDHVELPSLTLDRIEQAPAATIGVKQMKFGAVVFDVFRSGQQHYARAFLAETGDVAWYRVTLPR